MSGLRVTVPGSTSNLGSGFDCIGLALDRYLTATFEPGEHFSVERRGTLAELSEGITTRILNQHNVLGRLVVDSTIPIGRGLGSSAAAAVAGLAIVSAVRGLEPNIGIMLDDATALEGHPDNVAPSLLGGLIAVLIDGMTQRALRLQLSDQVGFVYAAPGNAEVSTKAARRALPDTVTHGAATRTIARSVALVEGLAKADPGLLRIGLLDELHVPYRIGMIPGGLHVVEAAVAAGAWAATISGSGSGLIALCEHGSEESVLKAMTNAFETATAQPVIAFVVHPDYSGLRIEKL